jgi:hypothetical protein
VGLLGFQPVQAQSLSTYDSFTSALLNPRRWYGEDSRFSGGIRTEARRLVLSDQARIENRTWGDTFSDTGTSSTRNSLVALKSPAITAMRGTITVRSHTLTACAANTSAGVVRARLFGFYFNAGEAIPGSSINDVFAGVQIHRFSNSTDPANVFRISAFLGICGDENCINTTALGSQDLGTVTMNTAATVEVRWDAANNRFIFQRDSNTPVNLPYTVADALPSSSPAKRIEVSNNVPRCTTTPRPVAFLAADFDNVMVNTSALAALAPRLATVEATTEDEYVVDELVGPAN